MVLARASASWKPHTRQLTETISRALVWRNTNVAFVVVTVRPQAFGRAQVARARQVDHCPETRPETTDVTLARQRDTGLQMATLVTELVPGLDHTRSVVETVVLEKVEFEIERAVFGVNGVGIVPLSSSQH